MDDLLQIERRTPCIRVAYPDGIEPLSPGVRPLIIPLFLPQKGCPHQCAFCDQHKIAAQPHLIDDPKDLTEIVAGFLAHRRRRGPTQIAFYGGNFLGMTPARVRRYLEWAARYVRQGVVDSLRFSTRPDTITSASLALIQDYPVRTVELGVQSMDDRVLAAACRGHNARDTRRAVARLTAAGYEIGLQIMTGLPDSTPTREAATVAEAIALQPSLVRIYPTLVLAGSPLAAAFQAGRYKPPDLEASIDRVARAWLAFTAAGIRVVRMGLHASPTLADPASVLAGPYHPAFGELVLGRIFRAMAEAALRNMRPATGRIRLRVNPRRISAMTGMRRSTVAFLRQAFPLAAIEITADGKLAPNEMEVDNL
jgi:histone acetyltransferase (RNA polymerase elongator complex component)